MHKLIQDYEIYVSELQAQFHEGNTYFQKFSDKNQVYQQIAMEEQEISILIQTLKEKANQQKYIQQIKSNLIPDHFDFKTHSLKQLKYGNTSSKQWSQYLKINHEIVISIQISEIFPMFKSNSPSSNLINFDSLKFRLYHINKSDESCVMRYQPAYNMYHNSHLLSNHLIKDQRSIQLQVRHVIRSNNYKLFEEQLSSMPIKIVAESSYGLILGIANINIDDIYQENRKINKTFRCIVFKKYYYDHERDGYYESDSTLIAKINISIQANTLAPPIQELKNNAYSQIKRRKNSKQKSPNKLISVSPANRSSSPKQKRQMITCLTRAFEPIIYLCVFDGRQYKYELKNFSPSKEKGVIVYKQSSNIKQKRIELIKVDDTYKIKCLLIKQNSNESHITFLFNNEEYVISVIDDRIFDIVPYENYSRMAKENREDMMINKLIWIGGDVLICSHQNNKVLRNVIKQTIVDGILSSIFIKTPFEDCQIFTNSPYVITDIVHKSDGYMIYFYYEDAPIQKELDSTLVFFFKSKYKSINQIHIFDCKITPRSLQKDVMQIQLKVNHSQTFYNLSMKMIASESYQYQIRSISPKINIINGSSFRYKQQSNQKLLIQLIQPIFLKYQTYLILYDNKYRSFFINLILIQEVQKSLP